MSLDSEITSRLDKLNISQPEVVKHDSAKGGPEWKAQLEKAGKADLGMTKTVCSPPPS